MIRVILGAVGMMLGGLAPLATGIIGVHGYVTKGYFISRTGDHISGLSGILVSMFFILAGFAMIAYGIWKYRVFRQRSAR